MGYLQTYIKQNPPDYSEGFLKILEEYYPATCFLMIFNAPPALNHSICCWL
jgi:hypothetical protein